MWICCGCVLEHIKIKPYKAPKLFTRVTGVIENLCKRHWQPFDNELCIICGLLGLIYTFPEDTLQRELLGIIAFPHRAWGLSLILTDMSFQGKKMYQIGSPDKSWQTNQKQREIRRSDLRAASHSDWEASQVSPCQATDGNGFFRSLFLRQKTQLALSFWFSLNDSSTTTFKT